MRFVPALFLAVVLGCSSSREPRSEVATFLGDLDRAICDRENRCETQLPPGTQLQACHPHRTIGLFADVERVVARGDARFDRAAAERCLAEVRGLPCHVAATALPMRSECSDWIVPQRREGEPCDPTVSLLDGCVPETFCARTEGCDGACARAAAPLESCESRPCLDGSCGLGLEGTFCSGEAPGLGEPCVTVCASTREQRLACREGTCVLAPTLGLGDDCRGGDGTCGETLVCDGGLCRSDDGGVGDECATSLACGRGLWCDDGVCAPPRALGEPCEGALCAEDMYCTRGVCSTVEEPFVGCYASGIGPFWLVATECPAGTACVMELQRCLPIAEPGGACDRYTPCDEGARCVDGGCRTIVGPDEPCGTDAVCPIEHACREARCIPTPILGEACDGACLDSVCVSGRCVVLEAGAVCTDGRECDGRICLDGVCGEARREGEPCGRREGYCARGLLCLGDANDDAICVSPTCDP